MTIVRRRTLLALVTAGATAIALPQTAGATQPSSAPAAPYRLVLPEPTGPYKIGTTELHHGSFADYQFSFPAIAKAYGVPPETVTELLGKVDPAGSVAAQRAYLGAYFDQFLKHRPQRLLLGESPKFPEVRFVR